MFSGWGLIKRKIRAAGYNEMLNARYWCHVRTDRSGELQYVYHPVSDAKANRKPRWKSLRPLDKGRGINGKVAAGAGPRPDVKNCESKFVPLVEHPAADVLAFCRNSDRGTATSRALIVEAMRLDAVGIRHRPAAGLRFRLLHHLHLHLAHIRAPVVVDYTYGETSGLRRPLIRLAGDGAHDKFFVDEPIQHARVGVADGA